MADNTSLFGNTTSLFNMGQSKGQNLFGSQGNNNIFGGSLFGDKGPDQKGLNFNNMNIFGKENKKEEKKDGENNPSLFGSNKLFHFNFPKNEENNKNPEKNNTADNSQLNNLFFSSNNQPVNINSNIQNVGNVHINIYGNKIENIKKEENEENYDEKDEVEEEEIKKEEKKEEKDNKEDKEKIKEEKVSEELNKPDELKSVDNRDYLGL